MAGIELCKFTHGLGFKYHTDVTKGNIFLIKRQFLAMKLKEMISVAVYMNLRRNQS
jgi:hypothetical protein